MVVTRRFRLTSSEGYRMMRLSRIAPTVANGCEGLNGRPSAVRRQTQRAKT